MLKVAKGTKVYMEKQVSYHIGYCSKVKCLQSSDVKGVISTLTGKCPD